MTDANVYGEVVGLRWNGWVKKPFLGGCVSKLATGFLCAGSTNRMLYQFYRVPEVKLVPFAYSWGYKSHFAV
jgi:hypothetical protein